jgi:hypothetical protein
MLNFIFKHKKKFPKDVIDNLTNVMVNMKEIMNKATQKNITRLCMFWNQMGH